MRISKFNKSLISGIFSFLFVLLAGNACSKAEPMYAGWTVGRPSGRYATILRSTDSGKTWIRQGAGQIAAMSLSGVFAVDSGGRFSGERVRDHLSYNQRRWTTE
ncbi:MAG: hypothetical protein PHZ02_13600 [Desulfocapsaceae bacterium]|nr:hypothetical protein [Desulfocapsaceae bacterium]